MVNMAFFRPEKTCMKGVTSGQSSHSIIHLQLIYYTLARTLTAFKVESSNGSRG
jgi:hypothetical protein